MLHCKNHLPTFLRSFSKIYNNMSELCFNQCVWDFGTDQVNLHSFLKIHSGEGQGAAVRAKLYRALHEKSETDGRCFHGVPARKQYASVSGPVNLKTKNESCSFNKSRACFHTSCLVLILVSHLSPLLESFIKLIGNLAFKLSICLFLTNLNFPLTILNI